MILKAIFLVFPYLLQVPTTLLYKIIQLRTPRSNISFFACVFILFILVRVFTLMSVFIFVRDFLKSHSKFDILKFDQNKTCKYVKSSLLSTHSYCETRYECGFSLYVPIIRSQKSNNFLPCSCFVKQLAVILPVGKFLISNYPLSYQSFTKIYLILSCFFLFLLIAFQFFSNKIDLLLS